MENNITTRKNFVTRKIVELVRFLTDRITNEDAFDCSWGKLMCDLDICSICQTTKNTEMMKEGRSGIETLKRSFKREKGSWKTINNMDSCEYTLSPKL